MARLIGWWVLVLALVAGASGLRYESRQAYAASNAGQPLADGIERVLAAHGYRITGAVGDPDSPEGEVGFRFSGEACEAEMTVAEFSITKIASAFAEEFMTDADARRYFFYDYSYETAARPTLTALWAWHLLRGTIGLDAAAATRNQIVVVWPGTCPEPSVDWPAVWLQKPQKERG